MSNLIKEKIRGFEMKFKTSPGVFSKSGLDSGSRLLLENVRVQDHTMIADLGCGSGVIGFVAARLNSHGHVHLLDVNLRFVNIARENAALNQLKNVEVYLSDLFSGVSNNRYHLILSNPPQHIGNDFLDEAANECYNHLKEEGLVLWVVQKRLTPVIGRLFKKHFGNSKVIAYGKDHTILEARKVTLDS